MAPSTSQTTRLMAGSLRGDMSVCLPPGVVPLTAVDNRIKQILFTHFFNAFCNSNNQSDLNCPESLCLVVSAVLMFSVNKI